MAVGQSDVALGHYSPGARASIGIDKILNFILFCTVTTSFIAFIEPSPHDVMMLVLLFTCVIARIPFDRRLAPLLVLIIIWLIGGAFSLMEVAGKTEIHPTLHQIPTQYFATSIYMCLATLTFACLVSDGNPTRLLIIRRASILSAMISTAAGYAGFFHLVPGAATLFLEYARVSGTFKDPNVYGPFLILPIVLLMVGFLTQRVTAVGLTIAAFLSGGLFLSFSRGAWVHLAVSAVIAAILCFLTAPNTKQRTRIVGFAILTTFAMAIALVALLSISSVHDMFVERAKVLQPYDSAGSGGRFSLQQLALGQILDHPNGMGPYGFSDATIGGQQHNVYLQVFLVYGWLGGAAYLAMIFATITTGLRCVFQRTPWQTYLIAAYGTCIGEIGEGIIIDTDHWRHFFLVLGLVWGLSVATINWQYRQVSREQVSTRLMPHNNAAATLP